MQLDQGHFATGRDCLPSRKSQTTQSKPPSTGHQAMTTGTRFDLPSPKINRKTMTPTTQLVMLALPRPRAQELLLSRCFCFAYSSEGDQYIVTTNHLKTMPKSCDLILKLLQSVTHARTSPSDLHLYDSMPATSSYAQGSPLFDLVLTKHYPLTEFILTLIMPKASASRNSDRRDNILSAFKQPKLF